ncbi:putative integrase [Psychrobacillus phage Perkons]|nr:putative integrase [Psychrobacillus phage Perkons]
MKANKMYNEDVKLKFLEQYENEDSKLTIQYLFFHSFILEDTLKKDLYDFNINEIAQVIISMNVKSITLAKNKRSEISKFLDWAIEHNFRKDNLNPLQGIEDEWLTDLVDKTIKQFISKQKLDEIISELVNYQDKIIPLLIFNGVYGHQCSELRNLRMKDIQDDGTVRLRDDARGERIIHLEENVIELLRKANSDREYQAKNGLSTSRNAVAEVIDSEYIIKPIKKGKTSPDGRISQITIINRIMMIAELFDIPELTPKSIQRSGMIYMAYHLSEKKDIYDLIGERFNWRKIVRGDYENYNISYMRSFLNDENITMLYGNNK